MAEPIEQLTNTSLADLKVFAQFVADIVTKQVLTQLDSTYLKVFGGVISILASAIAYLYFTQRSERKEAQRNLNDAYKQMVALIGESTKTMETVKRALRESKVREKKAVETLTEIEKVMRECNRERE